MIIPTFNSPHNTVEDNFNDAELGGAQHNRRGSKSRTCRKKSMGEQAISISVNDSKGHSEGGDAGMDIVDVYSSDKISQV